MARHPLRTCGRVKFVTKPTKHSASLVIYDRAGRFLVVKRPEEAWDQISGVWGFPAATAAGDASEIETALRVASDKLGVAVNLGRRIGESTHERRSVIVHMVDYEAWIVSGTPTVPQSDSSLTQYEDLKYIDDPSVLFQAARQGSQCSQIFLEDKGITWQLPDDD
jgi:8-oxo-dGTP diphosphatase